MARRTGLRRHAGAAAARRDGGGQRWRATDLRHARGDAGERAGRLRPDHAAQPAFVRPRPRGPDRASDHLRARKHPGPRRDGGRACRGPVRNCRRRWGTARGRTRPLAGPRRAGLVVWSITLVSTQHPVLAANQDYWFAVFGPSDQQGLWSYSTVESASISSVDDGPWEGPVQGGCCQVRVLPEPGAGAPWAAALALAAARATRIRKSRR